MVDARSELLRKIDHYDCFHLEKNSEMILAKHLIKFRDVLLELSEDLYPSKVNNINIVDKIDLQ